MSEKMLQSIADSFTAAQMPICGRGSVIEAHNIIRILICRQQPLARGVNREMTRSLALCGLVLHGGQTTRFWIDGEHGDAIVSPIGTVNELAGGMNLDFGTRIVASKIGWQSGDGLELS